MSYRDVGAISKYLSSATRWLLPVIGALSACTAETAATASREVSLGASTHAITVGDSALRFDTLAIRRGNTNIDVAIIASNNNASGVTELRRSDFVEIWQSEAAIVEQSWRFDHMPGDAGALTVTVDAKGLDDAGTTSEGLELRRGDELSVRYSHGTWVDAGGRRSEIPARFDSGTIMLTVPAQLVSSSRFPATLDPKTVVTPVIIE